MNNSYFLYNLYKLFLYKSFLVFFKFKFNWNLKIIILKNLSTSTNFKWFTTKIRLDS